MKLKTLAAAIAVAGAMASAQSAFASLTPAQANAADVTLYVSGASATDAMLANLFEDLCDSDFTYFSAGTKIPDSAQQAYSCKMSSAHVSGLPATPTVVTVFKRSAGGSGWGVGPVADGTNPIDFLNLATCPGTSKVTALPADAPALAGVTMYTNCPKTGNQHAPNAGISDVEPKMFTGANLINPLTQENAADGLLPGDPGTVAIDSTPFGANIFGVNVTTFGVPVTLNLYRALQQAQGLDYTSAAKDDVANMPSLSREQISSIMSGGVSDWGNLTFKNGASNVALTSIMSLASTKVEICRRAPGSGTQAQFNALFNNVPCSASANAPLTDNTPTTSRVKDKSYAADGNNPTASAWTNLGTAAGRPAGAVPAVHEMQGSGDVTSCLDVLNDANVAAIGVQSLEKASTKWRFVKINGVAPTVENVGKNNYFDWAVSTMQWKSAGAGAPTGQSLSVLNAIKTAAGNPVTMNAINATFSAPSQITNNNGVDKPLVGGLVLRGTTAAGINPSNPYNPANPVMTAVRLQGTATLSTCATALVKSSSTLKTELDISAAD